MGYLYCWIQSLIYKSHMDKMDFWVIVDSGVIKILRLHRKPMYILYIGSSLYCKYNDIQQQSQSFKQHWKFSMSDSETSCDPLHFLLGVEGINNGERNQTGFQALGDYICSQPKQKKVVSVESIPLCRCELCTRELSHLCSGIFLSFSRISWHHHWEKGKSHQVQGMSTYSESKCLYILPWLEYVVEVTLAWHERWGNNAQ